MKYNNGDFVIVTHNEAGSMFESTPITCILSCKTRYDYLATPIGMTHDEAWFVGDKMLQDLPDNSYVYNGSIKEDGDEYYTLGRIYQMRDKEPPRSDTAYFTDNDSRGDLEIFTIYMSLANFDKVEYAQKPVGKILIKTLEFEDSKGSTTTIKRSKCRHYYIKKPGQIQVRVSKAHVAEVVARWVGAL